MKRQRNTQQIKEQDKCPPNQTKEEEIERLKSQEKSSWWENFQDSYRHILQLRKEPKPSTAEMFETERHILEQLASRESCVVAGRSGFIIFRDWKNHLNIFIQAPLEQRIERVMKKQGLTYQAAIDTIDQVDEGRETYIRKYCDRTRYDTRNYDLVINMTGLTEDDAVSLPLLFGLVGFYPVPLSAGYSSVSSSCLNC